MAMGAAFLCAGTAAGEGTARPRTQLFLSEHTLGKCGSK